MNIRKFEIAALMAGDKFVVFRAVLEKRFARDDVVAVFAVLYFTDNIVQ